MAHRLALGAASIAAVAVLTAALAAAGFAPGAAPQVAAAADSVSAADAAAAATAEPTVQVDTVYVAAPANQQTITVHKVVKSTGGDDESETESGGDN